MERIPEFTKEELEYAKLYNTHLVHEIETALMGEIEKMEGRVPLNMELMKHGKNILNKDMSCDFFWKNILILSVKPNSVNGEGQRGTNLIIHKQPEKVKEA